jgi:hypothetical protein
MSCHDFFAAFKISAVDLDTRRRLQIFKERVVLAAALATRQKIIITFWPKAGL